MDIKKVIRELQGELARIDEAIDTLERLQTGMPRRGRPPGWLTLPGEDAPDSGAKPRRKTVRKAARI